MNLIAYTRSPETRRTAIPCKEKFHSLKVAVEEARSKSYDLVIAEPWIISDTHEEVMESLSRLAESGVTLRVAGR